MFEQAKSRFWIKWILEDCAGRNGNTSSLVHRPYHNCRRKENEENCPAFNPRVDDDFDDRL
jgi:hypothetical protein